MKRKYIVFGIIITVLLYITYQWWVRDVDDMRVPEETQVESVQERLEEKFNVQIPEDAEKAELVDEEKRVSAIATRTKENGTTKINILADLPDPVGGEIYQGWIEKGTEGEEGFERVSLGGFRMIKGGWIVEYNSQNNIDGFERVVISKESGISSEMGEKIVEGSF
jgi:hypothetical protein